MANNINEQRQVLRNVPEVKAVKPVEVKKKRRRSKK